MLFSKKKIPCYVLVFDQVEIIKKTLEFLTQYTDRLDIVVLENPSGNSPMIQAYLDKLGKAGLIRRSYLFEKNITGSAFSPVLNAEIDTIKSSKYVIITDGDITSTDKDWLQEQTGVLKRHRDVFACGISLDTANLPLETFPEASDWLPPDDNVYSDFIEVYTGVHLLAVRGAELASFMAWRNQHNLPFVDGTLHRYCTQELQKKWARTKKAKGYHLTWDLYFDREHPYTKLKLSKSFQKTWYHDHVSDYKLVNY